MSSGREYGGAQNLDPKKKKNCSIDPKSQNQSYTDVSYGHQQDAQRMSSVLGPGMPLPAGWDPQGPAGQQTEQSPAPQGHCLDCR